MALLGYLKKWFHRRHSVISRSYCFTIFKNNSYYSYQLNHIANRPIKSYFGEFGLNTINIYAYNKHIIIIIF